MSSGEPYHCLPVCSDEKDGAGEGMFVDIDERGDCHPFNVSFFHLPWDDVIFTYILPTLPIPTLFHLREVCTQFNELILDYFSVMKHLSLARIAGKMNHGAFQLLTCHSTNLHSLNLRNSKDWLTNETLMSVLKANPKLQLLDLTYCNSLSNACLQVLAVNCPRVKTLVLRDCPWLSTEGLTVVALNCNQLEKIDMTGCWNVTDDAVIVMAQSCSKLKSISMSNLYGLSDNALSIVARKCELLQHLNIQGCWRVTDDSVREVNGLAWMLTTGKTMDWFLAEYCKNLKMLQIRECRSVTEKTLSKLREHGVKMDKQPPPQAHNQRMDLLNLRLRHRLNVQI